MQTVGNVVIKAGKTAVRQQKTSRLWPSLFAGFNNLLFCFGWFTCFPPPPCTSFTRISVLNEEKQEHKNLSGINGFGVFPPIIMVARSLSFKGVALWAKLFSLV